MLTSSHNCHSLVDIIISMARFHTTTKKGRPGLARKAAEASAARLAACQAVSDGVDGVAGVVDVCPTPPSPQRNSTPSGRRTSPRHLPTDYSPPAKSSPSSGSPDDDVVVCRGRSESDGGSGKSCSSGDAVNTDNAADDSAENGDVDAEAFDKFFHNNNDNENDVIDGVANELDDLNDYSSDQFGINERVSYFMDRAAITANNRAAVEYVYMIEAETLTRGSGTRGLDDVKKLLHSKYISLIRQIPSGQFGEFGLHEKMIEKYYGAKTGGPSVLYTKVLDVKKKVQAVTRVIDGIVCVN